MKKNLTILLFFVCSIAYAQDYKTLIAKADGFYNSKNYTQSVIAYKQAFAIQQKSRTDLYNAACSAALAGDEKLAFQWLKQAIKNGWTDVSHLKSDADLTSLHGSKKWNKLIATMQKDADKREANYDKPLQAELLQIYEDDQKYRQQSKGIADKHGYDSKEMRDLRKIINEKDSINLIKVKAILDKYGWVGPEKVGNQANETLFLVIQHSNLATQQKYLPMMRKAVKNKKASSSGLALLEDRIALDEGKKQIYGSQMGINKETGKEYLSPLDDPDNVDKRRASVGLGPLADYLKRHGIIWNVEEYKKQLAEMEAKQKP